MNEVVHQIAVLREEVLLGRCIVVGADDCGDVRIGIEAPCDLSQRIGPYLDIRVREEEQRAVSFLGAEIPGSGGA